MAITKYGVKSDGRTGLVISGDGYSLHFGHDAQVYRACRSNRARDALRDALKNTGKLRPWAIREILNNPTWSDRYMTALDNNETIRECELLTAQMLAEEIVQKAENGLIQLPGKGHKHN